MNTLNDLIEKWENVRRVLDSLDAHAREKHFSMGYWGIQTDCGTVACAAGHCAMDPWFQERGFKARLLKGSRGLSIYYDGEWSFYRWTTMIRRFFGAYDPPELSTIAQDAMDIFTNSNDRTVDQVIAEIDAVLAKMKALRPVAVEPAHG